MRERNVALSAMQNVGENVNLLRRKMGGKAKFLKDKMLTFVPIMTVEK